jgi:hypothetical protein
MFWFQTLACAGFRLKMALNKARQISAQGIEGESPQAAVV